MQVLPITLAARKKSYYNNLKEAKQTEKQIYPVTNQINKIPTKFANLRAYNSQINFEGIKHKGLFKHLATSTAHPLWEKLIAKESGIMVDAKDSDKIFKLDYNKILLSGAYNRMAYKTQVFPNPQIDMTSTRIHHVQQVASVAEDIAEALGLNLRLTRAIAIGHDIGHSPFGHAGERRINDIIKKYDIKSKYWEEGFYHEKNSMRFADDIETELDEFGYHKNLDLTYAVRDGIISHCGEVDENGIKPRSEYIDLRSIHKNNRPQPFTWEGCVVKVSDKISYLGKDIEDAINNKFLDPEKLNTLRKIIKDETGETIEIINNNVLLNRFKSDLIANSNTKVGLIFSPNTLKIINIVKKFNYENIYEPKDKIYARKYDSVMNTVFETLDSLYDGKNTLINLEKLKDTKPTLTKIYSDWLVKYSNADLVQKAEKNYSNKIIYNIEDQNEYRVSIIEFMSGMTDRFAEKVFNEIINH